MQDGSMQLRWFSSPLYHQLPPPSTHSYNTKTITKSFKENRKKLTKSFNFKKRNFYLRIGNLKGNAWGSDPRNNYIRIQKKFQSNG